MQEAEEVSAMLAESLSVGKAKAAKSKRKQKPPEG